jgi:hypothetical protein
MKIIDPATKAVILSEAKNSRILFLLLLVPFFTSFDARAAAPMILAGQVTDTEGAKIPRAHVVLRTDFSGGWSKASFDGNATTDLNGMFTLNVGSGFYDLCVMADAFTPECRKIFIKDRAVEQKIRLRVSPKVSQKIGDSF